MSTCLRKFVLATGILILVVMFMIFGFVEDVWAQEVIYDLPGEVVLASKPHEDDYPNDTSIAQYVSDSGIVEFRSEASNLVPNDENGERDTFLYNPATASVKKMLDQNCSTQGSDSWLICLRNKNLYLVSQQNGSEVLVTRDENGLAVANAVTGNSVSFMTSAGTHVLFTSSEPFVTDDTNNETDVYLFSRLDLSITRVSVKANGEQITGKPSFAAGLSGDGNVAFFRSQADLGLPYGETADDIYAYHIEQKKLYSVSGSLSDTDRRYNQVATSYNASTVLVRGTRFGYTDIIGLWQSESGASIMLEGVGDVSSFAISGDGLELFLLESNRGTICHHLVADFTNPTCYSIQGYRSGSAFSLNVSSNARFLTFSSYDHAWAGDSYYKLGRASVFLWSLENEENKLVAHYSFNDGTATDQTLFTNHGTVSNQAKIVNGAFGKALQFPGQRNRNVVVANSESLSIYDEFTYNFWFKHDATLKISAPFGKSYDRTGIGMWMFTDEEAMVRATIHNGRCCGQDGETLSSSHTISPNEWHMATVTKSLSEVRLYVDGVLAALQDAASFNLNPQTANENLYIGGDFYYGFSGTIDEFKVFNYELSSAEVANEYNKYQVIEKRPIVLIPGTGASLNWACFMYGEVYCDLPGNLLWQWMPGAGAISYNLLLSELRNAGLSEEDYMLSVFFYDWRKPIQHHDAELAAHIATVKSLSGYDEVDLVGHSQGGLVIRSYVQHGGTDVRKAFLVGTPNEGSPMTYPYVQAGQAYGFGLGDTVVTALVNEVFRSGPESQGRMFRRLFPSFQQMLPTYDYIWPDAGSTPIAESTMTWQNEFLPALNASKNTLSDRTEQVVVIAGSEVATTQRFFVQDRNTVDAIKGHWADGKVVWNSPGEIKTNEGDDTVPLRSATLIGGDISATFSHSPHMRLLNNVGPVQVILNELGHEISTAQASEVMTETTPAAFVAISGTVSITLTDPVGNVLNRSQNQIAGSQYIREDGYSQQLILLPTEITEGYTISVTDSSNGYSIGFLNLSQLDQATSVDAKEVWITLLDANAPTLKLDSTSITPIYEVEVDPSNMIYLPIVIR